MMCFKVHTITITNYDTRISFVRPWAFGMGMAHEPPLACTAFSMIYEIYHGASILIKEIYLANKLD